MQKVFITAKKQKTYFSFIVEKLNELELGASFKKRDFIIHHRYKYDYFADRSFSAMFVNAKKLIPEKKFRSVRGSITRIQ
jgi:hypothetical protein